jgi:diaminohydroxyphosphoribosylaminopyrimidine deaminase/5-amino-6-(5-phosphoribosylamino)uracil reductase
MYSESDEHYMRQALERAARGLFTTSPNPRVGCLMVKDGQVVAEGWHERAGEAHAEVMAIRHSDAHALFGATAYITLEPCSHQGRTPPCTDALIKSGVRQVIVAMQDPNPQVSGTGLARLREAGIDVRCGLLAEAAAELNPGFIKRMNTGLPWLRVKSAASIDGRTALPDGHSQWITGPVAREDVHRWRARACAVLTGIGTVRQDDPEMNVRAVETSRQPFRILVDTRFEVDPRAKMLADGHALVAVAVDLDQPHLKEKARQLRDRGIEVLAFPPEEGGRKLDLGMLVKALGARQFNEIHIEAGARLSGAFMRQSLVDEWLVYLAPVFLGQGMPLAEGVGPWSSVEDAPRWRWHETQLVGDALRVRLLKN